METALRILIVEDVPADAELVVRRLRDDGMVFSSRCVETREDFIDALENFKPDVLLLDYNLPQFDALTALAIVREKCPETPCIIVTGALGDEMAVETLKNGAVDYVLKERIYKLTPIIQRALREVKEKAERKRAEKHQELALRVLATLNRGNDISHLIADILHLFKEYTKIEAVGIRLRDGDDYPYYETNGFAPHFVEAERHLCVFDEAGAIIRNPDGSPLLECMCGNVIRGRTDPSKPFFTPNGSFWSNCTTELLASTTEKDRQARTRNRCNGEGYESVALIPLRTGKVVIGLLQLNDRRKGMFTIDMINFLEEMGASIGIAVARRQAVNALLESEEKFRTLIENSSDVGYSVDAETSQFRYLSPNFELLLGYSEKDIGQMGGRLAFLKQVVNGFESMKKQFDSMKIGKEIPPSGVSEAWWKTKSGEQRYILDHWRTMVQDGKLVCTNGILRDISKRKRAEDELIESRGSLNRAQEIAHLGSWDWDVARSELRWSEELYRIFGIDPNTELTFDGISERIHPDDRARNLEFVDRVFGKTDVTDIELRMIRPDGSVRQIYQQVVVRRDEIGNPDHIFGIIQDITERKRAEEKIVTSEMRYRRLFEATRDGILILNAESGKIDDVNPFLFQLLGYSREDFLGKELWEFGFFKDIAESRAAFIDLQKTGYVRYDDLPLETVDGKRIEVEFVSNVYEVGGRKVVQCNVRDISERKRMEATQTKLQKRLLQSQKMEAVGTLAGGIAHDFNNILAAIIGYAELAIQDAPEGSQVWSDLGKILQAGNRAKDVVNQILTFSRQGEEGITPLNIAPIIKEVLKLLHATLPSTISVVADIKSEIGSVIADPSQIHQVLMNLCTNAAHAMNKTGGTLTVTLHEITIDDSFAAQNSGMATGCYVQLAVSDTGYGMTGDVMDRIFEPYYTTKGTGEGSGLGLSIVHGIVESMKGTINVYSEPGKGTTFKVYLPVTDQESILVETIKDKLYSGQGRILFVDDEPAIVEIGARILKSLGYEVTAMTSSVDALDFFQKNHAAIDLVISDMNMPFIPGDELARDILEIRPDMPIIICTGYSDRLSADDAMAMGIRYYLGKPLLKSEIAEKVHDAISHKWDERSHDTSE